MNRTYGANGGWITQEVIVDQYNDGKIYLGSNEEGSLDKVIDSFVKVRELIPSAFRSKAYCEIASLGDEYGSSDIKIEIGYRRPATIEEIETYQNQVLGEQQYKKQMELATLASLKAKYEPDG